jgi:hypothetical protein
VPSIHLAHRQRRQEISSLLGHFAVCRV